MIRVENCFYSLYILRKEYVSSETVYFEKNLPITLTLIQNSYYYPKKLPLKLISM